VSLLSAASVMAALDPTRFEVVPIGISKDGRWLAGPAALEHLRSQTELPQSGAMRALATMQPSGSAQASLVALLPDPNRRGLAHFNGPNGALSVETMRDLDVVFPVLHGPYGEDGAIQGLLELAGLPYVGAGVLGSALGMDKIAMKDVLRAHGIPVVDYVAISRHQLERDPACVARLAVERLGLPLFIKPANLGSSVGISKVHRRDQLPAALELAASFDRRILAEAAAGDMREIECSVLGNDEPVASLPGEVIPSREFYDYEAKYVDEGSQLIVPADLPPATVAAVRQMAVQAFLALDCAGMARVDFFVGRGDGRVILNELNTIPGFTSISMYPKMWQASGVSYVELLSRLIDLAVERHRDRQRSRTSYSPVTGDADADGAGGLDLGPGGGA
jgi:D-alanine-D-alanine ligase